MPTKKQFWDMYKTEKKEHPSLSSKIIRQIVKDHFDLKSKYKK